MRPRTAKTAIPANVTMPRTRTTVRPSEENCVLLMMRNSSPKPAPMSAPISAPSAGCCRVVAARMVPVLLWSSLSVPDHRPFRAGFDVALVDDFIVAPSC